MNDASRTNHDRHAYLDSHIASLLPLALPPHATSTAQFNLGILSFAHLFNELESTWQALSQRALENERGEKIRQALTSPAIDQLRTDLKRIERFTNDIEHLQSLPQSSNAFTNYARQQSQHFPLSLQISEPQTKGLLSADTILASGPSSLIHSCYAKPHLLIAHIYVWYMAVLSGGRYIRQTLDAIDPSFWGRREDSEEDAGYTFLTADAKLKTALKIQLAEWDDMLTEDERREVVEETTRIYDATIDLVKAMEREFETLRSNESREPLKGVVGEELRQGLGQGPRVGYLGDGGGWLAWIRQLWR